MLINPNISFFSGRVLGTSASGSTRRGIRFARVAIVISMVIMIVSLCVVVGFQQTIATRVADYMAHIRITAFARNSTFEFEPIAVNDELIATLRDIPHVKRVTPFYTKPAVLRTDSAVLGAVLLATPADTLTTFSRPMYDYLGGHEDVMAYFVGSSLRVRRLHADSVVAPSFSEGDMRFVRVPASLLQQIDGLGDSLCSGLLVWADDLSRVPALADDIWAITAYANPDEPLLTETLIDTNPAIFSWLRLLDMNVVVILTLMFLVAGFSMVSALILLVLTSFQALTTLRMLGASSAFLSQLCLRHTLGLVLRSMLLADAIGLTLCAIQYSTHLLPLDPASYYVSYVPVAFPVLAFVTLNIATILFATLILLLPSRLLTKKL